MANIYFVLKDRISVNILYQMKDKPTEFLSLVSHGSDLDDILSVYVSALSLNASNYVRGFIDAYNEFGQELKEYSEGSDNYLALLCFFDSICARRQLALHAGYEGPVHVLPTYRLMRRHGQRNAKDTAKKISSANKAFFETLYARA